MSPPRVLALGAHPDDVEIYCLGLLLKLRAAGWEIGWAVATDGQAGLPQGAAGDLRRREARDAGARVGVEPILLGFEDGGMSGGPDELHAVRQAVRDFAPTVIVAPHPADYHPDHRILSRLAADACPPGTLLLYADTMLGQGNAPALHVDVSAFHAEKRAALAAHASQAAPAFAPMFETWARFRALHCGVVGAESGEGYTPVESAANLRASRQLHAALLAG
jgi:LmbE family N-acetylglucosaminyl deacetylase